jgi:hypothetical protein
MGRHVLREDIDETIFTDEAQYFLAQLRGGCPGGESEALARTVANYPGGVSEEDVASWSRDPRFQAALKETRRLGREARAWDAKQAEATRGYDAFSAIPARDDPEPGPEGAFQRFVRHGLEVLHGKRESQVSNFTALEDVTDAQLHTIWQQQQSRTPAVTQTASPFRGGTLTKEQKERQIADGSYAPTDVERGFDGFPR